MLQDNAGVEQSVIGSLLLFHEELSEKIMTIEETDFGNSEIRNIFKVTKERYIRDGKYDFILVVTDLNDEEKVIAVRCMELVISISVFEDHLKRLKELSQKRRLASRLSGLLYSDFDLLDIQKIIDDEANNCSFENGEEKNKKNIDSFISGLGKQKPRIMTGFSVLDKITGGIRKGCVFYLGARPSVGKTALAINVAVNQKKYNQKVLIFSLEMSSEMIFERIVASEKHIEYNKFTIQSLSEQEIDITAKHMEEIKSDANLLVIDDIYTVEGICNMISEVKPDLVIVDFMQIVTTAQMFRDERVKMNYISSEFKRSAKRAKCAILALSQLTRDAKATPTMANLKESGNLEADGDYIALLHRPFVENKTNPDLEPSTTELILDKNKFGRTGKIDLSFDLKYQKFYEVDDYHNPVSNYVKSNLPFDMNGYEDI